MYHDQNTTEIIQGSVIIDVSQIIQTGVMNACELSQWNAKLARLWDLGASWPADPAGLTFCTSEGTLDRKSSTSLLSMPYGFRNFLVNLLIPKTDIHTNISLAVVPGGCAPVSTQTNTCGGDARRPRNRASGATACTTILFCFHF